jgi:hypothetical protein
MLPRLRPGAVPPFLFFFALVSGACSDPNKLDESQVVEVNLPDYYEVTFTGLRQVTDTRTALWIITSTRANVNVTNGITSGMARL